MEKPRFVSEFFVSTKEPVGYPVHFPDFSGETEGYNEYMRFGTAEDLIKILSGDESIDVFVESKDDYYDAERTSVEKRDKRHPKRFKRFQRIIID